MATTSHFSSQPEYLLPGDTKPNERTISNPRYHGFTQVLYTAGDEEQFFQHLSFTNGTRKIERPDSNIWDTTDADEKISWYNEHNLGTDALPATFRYLFHTVKKGIYVKIEAGELAVFLPFSKHNFENAWGDDITTQDFPNIIELMKYSQEKTGRKYNPRKFHRDQKKWIGNNFIIRNEFPVTEGDSNVTCLKDMFETLIRERDVPDVEFFLNRRDFPVMLKNKKHPYTWLAGERMPLYPLGESCLPVLSMCSSTENADIAIPTWDDWCRIAWQEDGRVFTSSYINRSPREYPIFEQSPFVDKIPKGVFRGGSTGQGVTCETNPRLKLASIPHDLLDVGISNWNLRPRVIRRENGKAVLSTIRLEELEFNLKDPISPQQQSRYKYIINVNGHVRAFRLSYELGMGSVVLAAKTHYHLWFEHMLNPYEHYVPIKEDLSDLISQLEWCETHQEKCIEIANGARNLYERYLCKKGILDYLQQSLITIQEMFTSYRHNVITVKKLLGRMEQRHIKKVQSSLEIVSGASDWYMLDKDTDSSWLSVDERVIYTGKTSTVAKRGDIIIKYSEDHKTSEALHEVFVRGIALNNIDDSIGEHLSTLIGWNDQGVSLWKYIDGMTLADFLKDERMFDLDEFVDICKQICAVTQILFEEYNFSHCDLYPWNIMLVRKEHSKVFVTKRGIIRSKGEYIVKLIDFGKAHIVYRNQQYGMVRPFYGSSILDTISYIISSANILLSRTILNNELRFVFQIMNFLTQSSTYHPNRFNNVREIRNFTNRAKKYTEMLYSVKGELESLQPADFLISLGEGASRFVEDKVLFRPRYPDFVFSEEDLLTPEKILHKLEVIKDKSGFRVDTFRKLAQVITMLNSKKNKLPVHERILKMLEAT